jgi:hypothetical protein
MEAADWVNLSDDELLEKRISQLGLKLEGTNPRSSSDFTMVDAKGPGVSSTLPRRR